MEFPQSLGMCTTSMFVLLGVAVRGHAAIIILNPFFASMFVMCFVASSAPPKTLYFLASRMVSIVSRLYSLVVYAYGAVRVADVD